jgi:hypothetical protein
LRCLLPVHPTAHFVDRVLDHPHKKVFYRTSLRQDIIEVRQESKRVRISNSSSHPLNNNKMTKSLPLHCPIRLLAKQVARQAVRVVPHPRHRVVVLPPCARGSQSRETWITGVKSVQNFGARGQRSSPREFSSISLNLVSANIQFSAIDGHAVSHLQKTMSLPSM